LCIAAFNLLAAPQLISLHLTQLLHVTETHKYFLTTPLIDAVAVCETLHFVANNALHSRCSAPAAWYLVWKVAVAEQV
jgi:hypothetical protein